MFSLEQNGEDLMISLEIDLKQFEKSEKIQLSYDLMISLEHNKSRRSLQIQASHSIVTSFIFYKSD